ncbi:MAG TPA: ferrochelatase [Povalibacter sp.]|uniref:ferrochelatase n=1 Tax=Povalibacter sp. TaxID=1962978 RepID=UPI002CD36A85|nr:ferrochelatase [Povalibacter sp.]HMN45462.1 ferrochelatase [Povalibacter sp.]
MPHYLGQPVPEPGSSSRLGVLLVNLGTPDSSAPGAVRRFLAEFLWDPRVVEAPRWLWWLALHGVILRIRPRRSAHAYQQIWTPQGSPLLIHSTALTQRLRGELAARLQTDVAVELGMSYGSPSIADSLGKLHREGVRRLIVLPLYPQYSGTTTASVFDRVSRALGRFRDVPALRFIADYHADPGYIEALADSVRRHWQTQGQQHLLLSFHGIPRRYVEAGDPYHRQSLETARLLAQALGLASDEWSIAFQSQVGREEWLRPYTDELLVQYATGSRKRISVICPGFATDCLETLEEIAIRNRALFLENGGESYDYIPALNATDPHVAALAGLIARNAQGWQAA